MHLRTSFLSFTLLDDNETALSELLKCIAGARSSIDLCTYRLTSGSVTERILDLLAAKAREGVRVRFLYDHLGHILLNTSLVRTRDMLGALSSSGAHVAAYNTALKSNTGTVIHRNHRKLCIVDRKAAVIGGRNMVAGQYTSGSMRDLCVLVTGDCASALTLVFEKDWSSAVDAAPRHSEARAVQSTRVPSYAVSFVTSGFADVGRQDIHDSIRSALRSAVRSIWIVSFLYAPDPATHAILRRQARAGLEVKLISARSSHIAPLSSISKIMQRHLARASKSKTVKCLVYRDTIQTGNAPGIHAKLLIVDGTKAYVGSSNFDVVSFFVNNEIMMVVETQEHVAQLIHVFRDMVANSDALV